MNNSTLQQPDRADSSGTWEPLKTILDKVKAAVLKWDSAWAVLSQKRSPEEDRKKQEELYAAAMEGSGWPEDIRAQADSVERARKVQQAGLALSPGVVTRLNIENLEQQRIVTAARDREDAEAEIRDLGAQIGPCLDRLRRRNPTDPRIEDALGVLQGLPQPLGHDATMKLNPWLERLVQAPAGRTVRNRRRSGETVADFIDRACANQAPPWKMPDLAQKSGVNASQICRLRKHEGVNVTTVTAVAGALGCLVDDLLPSDLPKS